MKNRDRDLLLGAAFEALRRDEAKSLSQADPRAQAELCRLEALKAALPGLKQVPECQLSVERVRDAILARQIRPVRPWAPRFLWAMGGLSGAATALFLVWIASPDTTDVPATVGPGPAIAQTSPATSPVAEVPVSNAVPTRALVAPAVASPSSDDVPARRLARTKRTARPPVLLASMDAHTAGGPGSPAALTMAAPETMATTPPVVQPPPAEPVIVVTDRQNPMTGAQQATEVSAPGDVVFGG